jgi:predicted phage terminase large subunit-like protein
MITTAKNRVVMTKDEKAKLMMENPLLAIRALNDRSLYEFLQWAWPELSSQPFVTNWHIPYICNELEEIAERVARRHHKHHDLLINVPPGSTKTILCSIVFPVWCWTKWHWMRFITASYSSQLSLESAEYARDLIKSDRFKAVYPELDVKADKDTKGNYKIVKRVPGDIRSFYKKELPGGSRFSTSVGGTMIGFHADIIIWDDPINPKQAVSENQLEIANRWLDQTLSTRKTNKDVSTTIGIMQRLHQNDPSGHLLSKKKKNLRHLSFPGECVNYGKFVKPESVIQYYQDGLFDKTRLNWEVLQESEADLGQYGFAGQIGQNPAPAGGGMFKVDRFQMTSESIHRNRYVKTVRFWDKAGTAGGKGAYTCGVKISKLTNGMFIIDDVKRGRWSTEERERIIRQTAIADGNHVHVCVEQEPGSGGKESAENTIRNLAGFMVSADRPTGDKTSRADPFSVQVNNGNVYLRIAEWNAKFKEEFEIFPNSTFKDQVDASSGGFHYLNKRKMAGRIT